MMAGTHRLISYFIVKEIEYRGIVRLDEKKFAWGSIKPDLAIPPFRKKHYMKETLDEIVDMILELASRRREYTVPELSERIGEVTHFITDFFCLPHSERWEFIKSGRTIEHIAYERKLHYLAQRDFSGIAYADLEFFPEMDRESIKHWILMNYESYQKVTDYIHDLKQAMGISLSITEWILFQRDLRESN